MDMPYKPVEYTIVRTVKCVWLVKEWNKLNELVWHYGWGVQPAHTCIGYIRLQEMVIKAT